MLGVLADTRVVRRRLRWSVQPDLCDQLHLPRWIYTIFIPSKISSSGNPHIFDNDHEEMERRVGANRLTMMVMITRTMMIVTPKVTKLWTKQMTVVTFSIRWGRDVWVSPQDTPASPALAPPLRSSIFRCLNSWRCKHFLRYFLHRCKLAVSQLM